MPVELLLAYLAYLVWLAAGLGDFVCHWRTDLPHTSGVAESVTHLIQLGLLGLAIVLGLAFAMSALLACVLLLLVVSHAAVGYADTWIAFVRRRAIRPVEQHVHSVLDMAPMIGLAWLTIATWPAAADGEWSLRAREPRPSGAMWWAVLAPAFVLCIVPALLEFRAAARARRTA